jgi:3'(2'), 5'-bisphosphate nucleotidase
MHEPQISIELSQDLALATLAARAAGARVLDLARRGRWSGAALADLGDHAADGYISGFLAAAKFADERLSEETTDDCARLAAERVWIIDPIDGSTEFGRKSDEWAIQVALSVRGRLALGVLVLPGEARTIGGICASGAGHVAFTGPGRIVPGDSPPPAQPRIAVSRSHAPEWIDAFAAALGGMVVRHSGVGFKVSRLLLGEADVYVHDGTALNEWDTAAPEAVARAAGWFAGDLEGGELTYNKCAPQSGGFLVCRPSRRDAIVAALAAARSN